jgi:purine nucleoside phosphorylase
MFDELKKLFIGAPNSMAIYTDYIDFKANNPEYKKGKGQLYCQRLPFSQHLFESVKKELTEHLKQINENLWLDESNYK